MHERFSPKRHRFAHPIFVFALDLDELPFLHRRLRLFSRNQRNLYALYEDDFFPSSEPVHNASTPPRAGTTSERSLKARVLTWLRERGIDTAPIERVELIALPRVAGYLFNPVSFYFFRDRDDRPVAAIAEVTNTFREVKPYLLGLETFSGSRFHHRVPKHFYVSPFSDVDVAFDFLLNLPGEHLAIRIDDYTGERRTLTSTLTGVRRELTDAALAWLMVKYPLVTVRTMLLIHWHALRLYLKRAPWFAKAARSGEQRDLYRPHASIAASMQVELGVQAGHDLATTALRTPSQSS